MNAQRLRLGARGQSRLGNLLIHAIMIAVSAVTLYPFLIILSASFQDVKDLYANGYSLIPGKISLDAYKMMLADMTQLKNSYLVTIATTALTGVAGLWVTTTLAYVMSRPDYGARRFLSFFVFFTMLFDGGLVPTYILMVRYLKLKNTLWALILPLLVNAWYVIMMKGFLQQLGTSLIESAKIDGAGEMRTFVRIVLPLSLPALATVGLFLVLGSWNDWFLSMLYMDKAKYIKLQYLLVRLMSNIDFLNSAEAAKYGAVLEATMIPTDGARMAMCVLATGPMLFVFPFFQRFFVRGITVGSLKG